MNVARFGVKGRTLVVLNRLAVRAKGKRIWMSGRETWSVLVSEYSDFWGILQ